MNTLQPQDSSRKTLKKLTKTEKKLKKNEERMGPRLLPQPPPRPWEANHSAPSIQKLLRGPWLSDCRTTKLLQLSNVHVSSSLSKH